MARTRKIKTEQTSSNGSAETGPLLTDEQRHRVEETAYLRAERRGFQGGTPEDDWYAAEREVLKKADEMQSE